MGLLKIIGRIELSQFWPEGESDADTTKIILSVTQDSFFFQRFEGGDFEPTSAFNQSYVRGVKKDKVVKNDKIKVRLQGIDAPELHFRAPALKRSENISSEERERYNAANAEFRQYFAESATLALSDFLRTFAEDELPCEVLTRVDYPYEVLDTYGRFVGNLTVQNGELTIDLNIWLAAEGWVFPSFYSSMSREEIEAILDACKTGRRKNRIWKYLSKNLNDFDYDLRYRGSGVAPDPSADRGAVILPKLFRRQVAWDLGKRARIWRGSLQDYLQKSKEPFFLTEEFIEQGIHTAPINYLHEYISEDDVFQLKPEELVFREKYSDLLDEDGNRVTKW